MMIIVILLMAAFVIAKEVMETNISGNHHAKVPGSMLTSVKKMHDTHKE